jgi:hypothetical protein
VTAAEPRRILANLLAEDDLARLIDPRRRHRPPSRTVLRTVARLAVELRVFAREGDRLWLPAPIDLTDPTHLTDPTMPPGPRLESGLLELLPPTAELLAWCETPDAVRLRGGPRTGAIPWDALLHELVWHLPVAPPTVVATVHHRAFHLRVAEELGCALPGARMVASVAELDRILARRNAPLSWVLKAPLSASGRDRFIARAGPPLSDPKSRRTVEHLFERHGPLLFEPWMDRVADYGCAALVTPSTLRIIGIHRQRVDIKGQFAGIGLNADLPDRDREKLLQTVEDVASALRREGYAGPFGVDAWTYRLPDGTTAFNPLGEINARMTFGLVEWTRHGTEASARLAR